MRESALTRWRGPCSMGLTPLLGTSSLPLTACRGRREQDWKYTMCSKNGRACWGEENKGGAWKLFPAEIIYTHAQKGENSPKYPQFPPTGHDLHSQHFQVSPLLPVYFLPKGRVDGHSTRPRGEIGMSWGSSKSTVPASSWDALLAQAQIQLHPYSDPPALCTLSLGESWSLGSRSEM